MKIQLTKQDGKISIITLIDGDNYHSIQADLPDSSTQKEISNYIVSKTGKSLLTTEEALEAWRQSASLSRRRFKIGEALYQVNGTPLVQLIETLLAGLTEPTKTVATISYEQSGSFDRLDPFVLQFSDALGMSDEETDDFFKYCLDEGWNNID